MRQLVRHGDIIERHFDVLDRLTAPGGSFYRALILMQQSDGVDQRQIFFVVTPRAGGFAGKGQSLGIGIEHRQRANQTLGIAMQG